MNLLFHADAKTAKLKLKKPLTRPDTAPQHDNPIRAFREELRLTRREFADLISVPEQTERTWENPNKPVMPTGQRLARLIKLAQRNLYPLYYRDIMDWCEKHREK